MGVQQSVHRALPFTDGVFPFLELPAEIRNQIYRYLLSTEYTKVKRDLKYYARPDSLQLYEIWRFDHRLQSRLRYHYQFQTAIIAVNRQIRYETHDVL